MTAQRFFTKHEEKKKIIKSSTKKSVYWLLFLGVMCVLGIMGGYKFRENFELQMPIMIKLQFPIKNVSHDFISPLASKSAMLAPQAYAEEKPTPTPVSLSTYDIVKQKTIVFYGEAQWPAMEELVQRESGFNQYAINKSSSACGLPQSLPCQKLLSQCGTLDDAPCQVDWMLNYIAQRYINPSNALAFHNLHHYY